MISCCTEELEDSELLSSSADTQTEPQELSSQDAMDLTSTLASTDHLSDSGVPLAEPSHLESTDLLGSLCESTDSPSPPLGALSLPTEPVEPPAVDPPCQPNIDLLPSLIADEPTVDDSPAQAIVDAAEPVLSSVEEPAEAQDEAPAHDCGHESDEEEPEEPPLE